MQNTALNKVRSVFKCEERECDRDFLIHDDKTQTVTEKLSQLEATADRPVYSVARPSVFECWSARTSDNRTAYRDDGREFWEYLSSCGVILVHSA